MGTELTFSMIGAISGVGFRLVREARLFGGLRNAIRHEGKDLFIKSAREGAVGAGTGYLAAKIIKPAGSASPLQDLDKPLKRYANLQWEHPDFSQNRIQGTFDGGRIGVFPCQGTRPFYDGFDPKGYYQIGLLHDNGKKGTFPHRGDRLPELMEHLKHAVRPPNRPPVIKEYPINTHTFYQSHE